MSQRVLTPAGGWKQSADYCVFFWMVINTRLIKYCPLKSASIMSLKKRAIIHNLKNKRMENIFLSGLLTKSPSLTFHVCSIAAPERDYCSASAWHQGRIRPLLLRSCLTVTLRRSKKKKWRETPLEHWSKADQLWCWVDGGSIMTATTVYSED